jgi:SAM-dependent methyltransferase
MHDAYAPPEAKGFLSRYAGFLRDRTEGASPGVAFGICHRLTGAVFGVGEGLHALLQSMRAQGHAWPEGDAGPDGEAVVQELARHDLLVGTPAESSLERWQGTSLFVPYRNPAVIVRLAAGNWQVTLPRALGLCRLPRTAQRPVIDVLNFDGAAGELLELACAASGRTDWVTLFVGREEQAADALDALTQPDLQLVRLSRGGLPPPDAGTHLLIQSFVRMAPAVATGLGTSIDAEDFYRDDLDDGDVNFDWVEPTVSHAFRRPSAALGGQTFGQRLGHFLVRTLGAELRTGAGPFRVLEIGGGLGFVARALAPVLVEGLANRPLAYSILDVSPSLQEHQRRALADLDIDVEFVIGEAQRALPQGARFDLVLANEVIADFEVSEDEPGAVLRQSGLADFLDGLWRIVAPGGTVFLSEYGSSDAAPRRIAHLNHPEFSIDFGDLAGRARALGFDVELTPLAKVLGFDGSARLLVGQQEGYASLLRLLQDRGLEALEYRAFDEAEFHEAVVHRCRPDALLWPPCAPAGFGLHFGPELDPFLCAVLSRPARQAAPDEGERAREARDAAARVMRAIDAGNSMAQLLETAEREAELCDRLLDTLPAAGSAERLEILVALKGFTFQAAAHACPALDESLELQPDDPLCRQALALAHRSRLATLELGHGDIAIANANWLAGVLHLCVSEFEPARRWLELAERHYLDASEWSSASLAGAYARLAQDGAGDAEDEESPPPCGGGVEQAMLLRGLQRLRSHVQSRRTRVAQGVIS